MMEETVVPDWPDIPYSVWKDTCSALHLYTQIVGKYRLARDPWINHSWHATLSVTARGLTTSIIPDGPGGIEVGFDLIDHRVIVSASDGRTVGLPLGPGTVASFHAQFQRAVAAVGGTPDFDGRPNEMPDPVPFVDDEVLRPYDAEAVTRFHQALVLVDRVLKEFRTAYLGKSSPVHLFWGSFDLAVTRFSGRRAPLHPGGIPGLPDEVTREAYSHEVSSAGFWPGGGGVESAAFYSYAYPTPIGFHLAEVSPAAAYFDSSLGEFVLPYEAVRLVPEPESALLSFLESTYAAAANLAGWDRPELECCRGMPRRPRPL
jgi:hypothetical protein